MRAYFRISVLRLLTSLALLTCSEQLGFAGPVPATQTSASAKGNSSGKSQPTDQEIANAKTHGLVWVEISEGTAGQQNRQTLIRGTSLPGLPPNT